MIAFESLSRSALPETRNPLLNLPSAAALAALEPGAKTALAAILSDLARDARARADKAWRSNKAPMAVYWKAVSVYATHTRRALRQAGAPAKT